MTPDEHTALQLWFQAFEPAVEVEVHPETVLVRSSRPRRRNHCAKVRRSHDLVLDLNAALAQLVATMG